ncbi:MAG: M1 family aminopeptidase, partial [Chitinophagales bacterium]
PEILDRIITHEIGHNWFYGVLGFNEREHPWMDEGINSYYENRCMEQKYPGTGMLGIKCNKAVKFLDLCYPQGYENYLMYLFLAKQKNDQAMDEGAALFTRDNYAAVVYSKTAEVFRYLEAYLGTAEYDSIMRRFFEEWKFRHPYPDDLRLFFEQHTGKELDWFFEQLITTTDQIDYALTKEDVGLKVGEKNYAQIKVKNTGEVKGPYSIAAYKNGKKINELWYGGFSGKMDVLFPEGNYDYFKLDADHDLPEVDRSNNYLRRKGLVKHIEPLRFQWLVSVDNPNRTQIFFTPLIGWNYYDGFTPGLALYNSVIFPKRINLVLVPQYGLRSGEFAGIGALGIPIYLKNSFLQSVTFSANARSYSYANEAGSDTVSHDLRFIRFSQNVVFELAKRNPRSSISQNVQFRNIFLEKEKLILFSDGNKFSRQLFNVVTYSYDNRRVINPYHLDVNVETGFDEKQHYAKLYACGDFLINYPGKKSGLSIRGFTGIFLSTRPASVYNFHLAATTGPNDYRFDRIFGGRSETTGFLSHQISISDDGGFKLRDYGVSPVVGSSGSWVFSMNLKLPLPLFMPVFAFADGGFAQNDTYDVFQYDAGIGVTLLPKIIEVYLPLFFSHDIKLNLNTTDFYNKWYKRITFTFNIDKLNPFKLIREFRL